MYLDEIEAMHIPPAGRRHLPRITPHGRNVKNASFGEERFYPRQKAVVLTH
ncbi:Uncharacterised protein [Vibrio cholerae]|nr:Uncharacterised protein [Vibrio cholerae]